jgi:hypothetical protein
MKNGARDEPFLVSACEHSRDDKGPALSLSNSILAEPPFSALAAWGVLGEGMTPLQMTGGAIILAAVLLSRPATASPSRRSWPSGTPRR